MKNIYNEYFIVLKFELFNLKIIIKVKSKDGFDGFKIFWILDIIMKIC